MYETRRRGSSWAQVGLPCVAMLLGVACGSTGEGAWDAAAPAEDAAGFDATSVALSDAGGLDGSEAAVDATSQRGVLINSDRCLASSCQPALLLEQSDYVPLSEAEDGWVRLIQADWQLAPRSEGYRCVRKTMAEDVYVTAFKSLDPAGTHHTTLWVEESTPRPDGVISCGAAAGRGRRLQGSGVGTEPSSLPEGVAMKVLAGEQLVMNLHLFNVGDDFLEGTSGVLVRRAQPEDVENEAEVILAGPLGLSVEPGNTTIGSSCTLQAPATLFAVAPHMHQLGRHTKVTAHSSIEGERVVHDMPYDFTHQLLYPIEPIELAAGDSVSIDCSYSNETGSSVGWGDSTLDEMCFVGLSVFPATGLTGFPCF